MAHLQLIGAAGPELVLDVLGRGPGQGRPPVPGPLVLEPGEVGLSGPLGDAGPGQGLRPGPGHLAVRHLATEELAMLDLVVDLKHLEGQLQAGGVRAGPGTAGDLAVQLVPHGGGAVEDVEDLAGRLLEHDDAHGGEVEEDGGEVLAAELLEQLD